MIKILDCEKVSAEEIFARNNMSASVSDIVADIIATVKKDGDKALRFYVEKFDGAKLDALEVT